MIRPIFYIAVFMLSTGVHSQLPQEEVLDRIIELQVQQDDFFHPGLFPASRSWSFSGQGVPDNTIFFTANICSTIRHLHREKLLEMDNRLTLLMQRATGSFWRYKSRNGRNTFNFWQTTAPDLPFPNGNKIVSNESMRLPDDFYTSVLVTGSLPKDDTIRRELREELRSYSARFSRDEVALFTPKEYEEYLAYELWFGEKMPQTFDLSVMSNVLHFVFMNEFPLNTYDSATIDLVRQMVLNRDYLHRIDEISLHTRSKAMVLYQLSKLLEVDEKGRFTDLLQQVRADISTVLPEVENEMEKMLLLTALYRMGAPPTEDIDQEKLLEEIPVTSHFSISPFAVTRGKRNLNALLPTVSWVSEAYNWMLYFEYLTYRKRG